MGDFCAAKTSAQVNAPATPPSKPMNSRRLMVFLPFWENCNIRRNWMTGVATPMAEMGLVSRVTPVHTAMRNSTRDEGGPFEVDNQVLISSHRKLLWSKAMVVSVAEKPKQDSGRHD
jgi:hypothetical protein